MRKRRRKSDCPVHFALEAFGDAWTLLIIRDLMFKGRTTYGDLLRAEEGIATNILADRLERMEQDGLISRREDERGVGVRYSLTQKGTDLLPVMLDIIDWSARHDRKTAADPAFVRRLRKDRRRLADEIQENLRRNPPAAEAKLPPITRRRERKVL